MQYLSVCRLASNAIVVVLLVESDLTEARWLLKDSHKSKSACLSQYKHYDLNQINIYYCTW